MAPISEDGADHCSCGKSTVSIASTASSSTADSAHSPTVVPFTGSLEDVDLAKVSCDEDGQLVMVEHVECDMCPFCDDVCVLPSCLTCSEKRERLGNQRKNTWTRCEVRRHCTLASAWLVVGDDVIDGTAFMVRHPAGVKSILRKAGGIDCTVDFEFHSKGARKMWKSYRVGTIIPCVSETNRPDCTKSDCTIM